MTIILLIENTYRLVDLLPQMGSKDLDKRDLERRNLSVPKEVSMCTVKRKKIPT